MVAKEVIKDQSQLSDSEIYTSEAYSEVLTFLTYFYLKNLSILSQTF